MISKCRLLAPALLFLPLHIARPADIVPFKNLDRLPAGSATVLQGSVTDIKAEQLAGFRLDRDKEFAGKTLADLIAADALKLSYKVAGLEAREVAGSVMGDKWSVGMDPLPENSSVTLSLEFSGKLGDQLAGFALDRALREAEFQAGLDKLFAKAREIQQAVTDPAKITQEVDKAIEAFIRERLPGLKAALPAFVTGVAVTEAPAHLAEVIDSLSALPARLQSVSTLSQVQNLSEADRSSYARVAAALEGSTDKVAVSFLNAWSNVRGAIQKAITAKVTASMSVVATSGVKDFEKYAGVDLGVAFIPGAEDLRSFLTVNVYLGPVEERPYIRGGILEALRQTVSLSVGYAFADVSGQNPQKALFRDNNAWLVGLGVRLNKYFRVSAGTAIYRRELLTEPVDGTVAASLQGKLRTAGFIAGSIDVTALPNLRALFGKGGATVAPPVSVPAPSPPKTETPKP